MFLSHKKNIKIFSNNIKKRVKIKILAQYHIYLFCNTLHPKMWDIKERKKEKTKIFKHWLIVQYINK